MPTLKAGTLGVALSGGTMIGVPAPHQGPEWSGVPGFSAQSLFVVTAGALPPGLSIAQKTVGTGTTNQFGWKGTPTTLGVFTATIGPSGTFPGGDFEWTISLSGGCPLVVVEPVPPPPLDDLLQGLAVSLDFLATDGVAPYSYDVVDQEGEALPDGLSLSAAGVLSGTPTTLGDFTFTIRATDDNGCPGLTTYAVSVVPAPPITIAPTTLPDGHRGATYLRLLVASGGIGAPYVFALLSGALPNGLTLSAGGVLSGIPTLPGAYAFTVRATDGAANTGDQAYTLTIRGLRIDIDGVDHLLDIAQADFELGLNQRSTATLTLGDGYIPDRLADVVLYARDGVTAILDGLILSRDTHGQQAGHPANAVVAAVVDYSVYFDHASVTLSYPTTVSVEAVIADVVYQALEEYGLTYTPVPTGLTLEPFAVVDVLVTDLFKQIADKTGVVIRMVPLKEIRAFVPGTDAAPVSITDGDLHAFDLSWKDGAKLTPNTVELSCGPSGPGQVSQQWIADGVASSWVTDLPAIDPPPILVEIDDGVSPYLATVVPVGTGGGMFEWDRDTHTLSLGTDPLPAAGTKITLGPTEHFNSPFTYYTVQFPFKVRVTTGETPPIVYRESRPDCVEYAAALQIAEGILERERIDRRDLDIVTDEDGFLPGQALTVNTTARGGIVGDFPVILVRGRIVNAAHWEYTLTAQLAALYQGSYVDRWKALTRGGTVGATSAAPVGAPVSGAVVGPGGSVDGEGVLFDGTTGQRLKRATGTGVVHRTSGVDAVSAVIEADITLADNTTLDVSTTKHGLVPKAPGDATKFLNGANPPAWAVPSGSGGALVQIAQIVTSGSQATVDFTGIPAGYSELRVAFFSRDTQAGTGAVAVRLKVNNDGTSGNYSATVLDGTQAGAALNTTSAASASGVFAGGSPQDGNTAGMVGAGIVSLIGYANTTFHKRIMFEIAYEGTAGGLLLATFNGSAAWKSTAAINRLTFGTDGTAFKDGSVFTLYGVL